jgi:hypothetical protein
MENSDRLNQAVDKAIQQLSERVKGKVDQDFIEQKLEPVMQRLREKQAQGKLSLADYLDFLRVYRNVVIPAVMKQEIDRLHVIKEMVKVS